MRIDDLIQQGEHLKNNLNKSNYDEIINWIAKSQLYVETKYKSLEFTKGFCSVAVAFKNLIVSEEMYDEKYFIQLLESLKSCKDHEEYQLRKIEEFK